MPKGYEKIILKYILPSIDFAEKHLLYPSDDAIATLEFLSKNYRIGVIGSHEKKISKILKIYEMDKFFDCCILSYEENREPDKEIFSLILNTLRGDQANHYLLEIDLTLIFILQILWESLRFDLPNPYSSIRGYKPK